MARADNYNRKNYVQNFDKAGFPIQSWDVKNTRRFVEEGEWNEFPIPEELAKTGKVHFKDYEEPIVFKDIKTGNTYAFYSGSGSYDEGNYLPSPWKLDKDEEGFEGSGGKTFFDTLIDLSLLQSKGKRYLDTGEEPILEEGEISEFETLEKFEDIDAPNYATMFATDPTMSEEMPKVEISKITTSQEKKAKELLEKSLTELEELKSAEKEGRLDTEMWSFQEIDELYNVGITPNEKRAFVIYLQNVVKKQIKGGFNEFYGSPYPTPPETILELMKKGEMFFDGSAEIGKRLQPKVLWLSGNLYKKMQFLKNHSEKVIQRFGEEIHKNHQAVLEPAYLQLWEERLTLNNADKKMRLKIIPISEMAREIQISKIIDPSNRSAQKDEFKIYTSFKKDKGVVKLHEEWVDSGEYRKEYGDLMITKSHISLLKAFLNWLKLGGIGQKAKDNGISYSLSTKTPQDISDRYIDPISNPYGKKGEARWEKEKAETKVVADRLFGQFLETGLTGKDRIKIEFIWNSTFNSHLLFEEKKIPIGFTFKKYDRIALNDIREEKREAIAYWLGTGSGIGLAYGVGMGKTFCAVFIMRQALAMGICTKPILLVPNQVYFQFMDEIGRILGDTTGINPIYNGAGTLTNQMANNLTDNHITIATYEAIPLFVFDKNNTDKEWLKDTSNILLMGGDGANEDMLDAGLEENKEDIFGSFEVDTDISMKEGGKTSKEKKIPHIFVNSATTGYDFICIDEAHNFNNLFQKVISAPKQIQTGTRHKKSGKLNIQRESNPYSSVRETAGSKEASKRATKFFFISQYIQSKNPLGNTLLLSATPFTNSPLQVYTLLTFCNRKMLIEAELGILKEFYDVFAQIEYAQDYKTNLQIVLRSKFMGWKNLIALQRFLFRTFKKKRREDEDKFVKRPNKITLPLKRKMIDGKTIEISMENKVSTTIGMSEHQLALWKNVQSYADGEVKYEELCKERNAKYYFFGEVCSTQI